MGKLKKTWAEKLNDDKDFPRIITNDETMNQRWGTGTCVISAPREVDGIMRLVPPGRLTTINRIREVLAKRHRTDIA